MADDNTSPKDPAEKTSTDKSGENKSKEPNDHSPRDFPEKGLGADRMVKELQDRYDKLRDWTDARGLTDPSDRQNDRGDQHFFAKDAPPLLLFRDTAAERSYHLGGTEYMDIAFLSMERGFHVTSTTGGTHNVGSVHAKGLAVDIRTYDMTAQQIDALISEARANGYRVRDERVRPAGQKEWSGPHIHISTEPGNFPLRDSGTRVHQGRDFPGTSFDRKSDLGERHDRADIVTPSNIRIRLP